MLKAIILGSGRPPRKNQIQSLLEQADFFIAADGGANTARKLGLSQPDFIIGDLDSYHYNPADQGKIIRDEGQETNDLEKALVFALKKGVSHVAVFGSVGRRIDHSLKNLSVLKQFHEQFASIRFIDKYGELILLPHHFSAQYPLGTIISLFPLSGVVKGITTKGLKFPLYHEALENGVRDGSSNETIADKIEITYDAGDLLMFTAIPDPSSAKTTSPPPPEPWKPASWIREDPIEKEDRNASRSNPPDRIDRI